MAKTEWMPDSAAKACCGCSTTFGVATRRHHCRACGKIFCSDCANAKMFLAGDTQPSRVCQTCYVNSIRPSVVLPDEIEGALQRFAYENEINPKFLPSLRTLALYDVVLVCDDSGSMCGPADPEIPNISRWDELKQSVQLVVRASLAFQKPIDIYFLNRGKFLNVTSWDQVAGAFAKGPAGTTPLQEACMQVWSDRGVSDDLTRDLIVHVFTDGFPNNRVQFEYWLGVRPAIRRTYISILLCTDEEDVVNEYRRFEYREQGRFGWTGPTVGVTGVDVTEDYRGEVRDIRATRGTKYRFSFGDYIVKCLVGCVDPSVHAVDLPPGMNIYGGSTGDGDCVLM
jgi:hypothetical protein